MPKAHKSKTRQPKDVKPIRKIEASSQSRNKGLSVRKDEAAGDRTSTSLIDLVQVRDSPLDKALREENHGYDKFLAKKELSLRGLADGPKVPHECLVQAEAHIVQLADALHYQKRLLDRTLQLAAERQDQLLLVVEKLFGYSISIQPNGNCTVASAPKQDECDNPEEREMNFIWDKTSKCFTEISSAPMQASQDETKEQLYEYWVKSRHDIPGFLATYHLETKDED